MLQFLTDRTLTIDGPAIPLSSTGDPVDEWSWHAGHLLSQRVRASSRRPHEQLARENGPATQHALTVWEVPPAPDTQQVDKR